MARLTVVLSQGQSQNPAKRDLEESIVGALLLERGIDVVVIPHLYDLQAEGTGVLALQGVSGHLVSGPAEWSARVGELMKDPAKRRAFGDAGRKRVVERYSVDAVAPRLISLVTG